MANVLNISYIPANSIKDLAIMDSSTYDGFPLSPILKITPPNFNEVTMPFLVGEMNSYTSITLGVDENITNIPDGIYHYEYSITPADDTRIKGSFMKVDRLLELFDTVFMKLDMMECDRAIRTQDKVELSTIYFMIQGAISASNRCADKEATQLYNQAKRMLDYRMKDCCGDSGNNYMINFTYGNL